MYEDCFANQLLFFSFLPFLSENLKTKIVQILLIHWKILLNSQFGSVNQAGFDVLARGHA